MALDNIKSHIENNTPSAITFNPSGCPQKQRENQFSIDTPAINTSQYLPLFFKKLFLIFIFFATVHF